MNSDLKREFWSWFRFATVMTQEVLLWCNGLNLIHHSIYIIDDYNRQKPMLGDWFPPISFRWICCLFCQSCGYHSSWFGIISSAHFMKTNLIPGSPIYIASFVVESLYFNFVILHTLNNLMRDNVMQSHQGAVIPFQILGGEAQMVQVCMIIIPSLCHSFLVLCSKFLQWY